VSKSRRDGTQRSGRERASLTKVSEKFKARAQDHARHIRASPTTNDN